MKCLISAGAAVDAANRLGVQPLYLCASGGHLDAARLLVKANAAVDAPDKVTATGCW